MKKILIALFLLSLCKVTHAQSIKIPTYYEVGYSFGFEGHMLFAATEFDLGV